jgi:N-acetylneuraminic acid mutarotase
MGKFGVIRKAVQPKFARMTAAILLGCCALPAQVNTWTTRAAMPTPRASMAAGVVDGILYLAAGEGYQSVCPNSLCGPTWAYDPRKNAWEARSPIPTVRASPAAAVVDGSLYVVGGGDPRAVSGSGELSTLEVYNPRTDTWTRKAPMPTARWGATASEIGGIIYVVGGLNSSDYLATVEAYQPKTDTWSTKAPMPAARAFTAAVVINGILYVAGGACHGVGGSCFGGYSQSVEAYDPRSDTWTSETPVPSPRSGLAGGVIGGEFYAVGGIESPQFLGTVESYDPTSNSWTTKPSLPTARCCLSAAVVDDVLYVLGGIAPTGSLAVNEAFTPYLMVSIDIKPGDPTNTINLNSNGVIPVAILGSATFDPMTVDPTTVVLTAATENGSGAPGGAPVASRGRGALMTGQSDVNNDGYPDLILYFRTQDLTALQQAVAAMCPSPQTAAGHRPALQPGDGETAEAVLYGTTYSGQRIRGSDTVRIVPPSNASPHALPAAPRGAAVDGSAANGFAPKTLPPGNRGRN